MPYNFQRGKTKFGKDLLLTTSENEPDVVLEWVHNKTFYSNGLRTEYYRCKECYNRKRNGTIGPVPSIKVINNQLDIDPFYPNAPHFCLDGPDIEQNSVKCQVNQYKR